MARNPFGLYSKRRRKGCEVKHEVTLIAFTDNGDGTESVMDIVETSNHYAYKFAGRYLRDPQVSRFEAFAPGPISGLNRRKS